MKLYFQAQHGSSHPLIYSLPQNSALEGLLDDPIIENHKELLNRILLIQSGVSSALSSGVEGWDFLDLYFTDTFAEIRFEHQEPERQGLVEICRINLETLKNILETRIKFESDPEDVALDIRLMRGSSLQCPPDHKWTMAFSFDGKRSEFTILNFHEIENRDEHSPSPWYVVAKNYFPPDWSDQKIASETFKAHASSVPLPQYLWEEDPILSKKLHTLIHPEKAWKGSAEIEILGWTISGSQIQYISPVEYRGESCSSEKEILEELK